VDSGDTEHAKSIARTIGDTRAALERDAAPRTANQAKKSKASARHARVVALARQRHPRLTNLQIAEEAGYRDERTVEKILTAQGVKRRRV
jgi:hypothetical protein